MGKGFNNYMCKKFFHPASRDNLKRVWMAEQKTAANLKKQEELRVQYEKEQDLYNNKAMLSKESKEKLSVNFLYEPPPGTKREREKEDGEIKFEWQRKFNAPRESYCKGDEEIRDQPFGIQVRNVRCIKCKKWGHINTDRECTLYGVAGDLTGVEMDPLLLMHKMREDGLAIKQSVLGVRQNAPGPNQELLDELEGTVEGGDSVDRVRTDTERLANKIEEDSELDFLKALSTKQKKQLLKKLEKLERKSKKTKKHDREKSHDRDRGGRKKSKKHGREKSRDRERDGRKKSKKHRDTFDSRIGERRRLNE